MENFLAEVGGFGGVWRGKGGTNREKGWYLYGLPWQRPVKPFLRVWLTETTEYVVWSICRAGALVPADSVAI